MAFAHPFFLCLYLFSPIPGEAASVYSPAVRKAYEATISLRIPEGRRLLQQELLHNPDNAAALLIANQQDFLTWAIQQNPEVYAGILARQEKRLQQLSSLSDNTVWVGYALAEVRLQIALSKLLQGNKLGAAWDLRQAYLQYSANARLYPDFLPNRKTLGALQVLIGSVPDSYRALLNIIGMQGSIETGMANLKVAATKSNPFREEAQLLLALLQHLVDPESNDAAAESVLKLSRQSPDNLLFSFAAMHVLKKTHKSDIALQVYLDRPQQAGYLAFPYLHHMAADLYLYKGDFSNSIKTNQLFLSQHKGENYLKAANYKLYLAHWLGGQPQQAEKHITQIAKQGLSEMDEDAYAARFVKEQPHPNRYLMLARLKYDGGYYQEALEVMNIMPLRPETIPAERTEYYYRKARIYHGLENLPQAKRYYEQAIEASQNTSLYFAPYAALQLGYIYQDEQKPDTARQWYTKALAYKGHTYKNSIDGKAKLALQTLKKL
ncbi:lipopolysaccharide assembly protein LapB [Pontibacter sp. HSC-36F09]|uniref:tetratricopeptide repeat protein n=1 Tax=Pontibacter sp. HSC-36F09 TaxID=2910966 RepID=UPI00209DFEC3|nr:tetratricopeptide repeat protein [Pontibacter sp. HSC-36F09]MCP2044542.1 hypothetical protein [Pontibacter sp. HSC-36F09]